MIQQLSNSETSQNHKQRTERSNEKQTEINHQRTHKHDLRSNNHQSVTYTYREPNVAAQTDESSSYRKRRTIQYRASKRHNNRNQHHSI